MFYTPYIDLTVVLLTFFWGAEEASMLLIPWELMLNYVEGQNYVELLQGSGMKVTLQELDIASTMF